VIQERQPVSLVQCGHGAGNIAYCAGRRGTDERGEFRRTIDRSFVPGGGEGACCQLQEIKAGLRHKQAIASACGQSRAKRKAALQQMEVAEAGSAAVCRRGCSRGQGRSGSRFRWGSHRASGRNCQSGQPIGAIAADLDRKVVVAGEANFRPAGPCCLKKQGSRLRGGGFVHLQLVPVACMAEEARVRGHCEAIDGVGRRVDADYRKSTVLIERYRAPLAAAENTKLALGGEEATPARPGWI